MMLHRKYTTLVHQKPQPWFSTADVQLMSGEPGIET